ncbi:MAG: Transcriptional regulatory protein ros [Desulfovibrio sp.]
MEEHVSMALEIVKAQAAFRSMTEEEICTMILSLSTAIKHLLNAESEPHAARLNMAATNRAPKDNSILCLECMKPFKMLTHKHMATHGLTPAEYREKWGYGKDTPLICKSLQRRRRKKMKDIKLWEKRRKKAPEETS